MDLLNIQGSYLLKIESEYHLYSVSAGQYLSYSTWKEVENRKEACEKVEKQG